MDNFVIACYLVILLLVALYNKSNDNYTNYTSLGKIKHHKLILTATIFASAVGGGTTFGLTESVYNGSLAYVYALLLTVPLDIMIAFYLAPKISVHYGATSIGDIVSKFYGKTGSIITGFSVIISALGYMAAQISVSSKIYQYLFALEAFHATILSYILLVIYTSFGGFKSVVFANLIQFIAMIIAIPVLACWGLYKLDANMIWASFPPERYDIFSYPLFYETLIAALSFAVMGFYPTLIQRMMSADSPQKITNAIFIKSAIYVVFIICIALNGIMALGMADQLHNSQNLLLGYIDFLIPPGLRGLIMLGFIAAAMSTADADLNLAGITFVRDILSKIYTMKSQRQMLLVTQLFTMTAGILSVYLALTFNNILELVIFAAGFWSPIMLVPIIALLYNVKITERQFICCSLISLAATIANEVLNKPVYQLKSVFIGTCVSLVIFLCCWLKNKIFYKIAN